MEEVRGFSNGLAATEKQDATGLERVMKDRDDALLEDGSEIDEDVAATNKIDIGEGRVDDNILTGENAEITNGFGDLVEAIDLDKKTPQALLGNIEQDVFVVNAGACLFEITLVEVRGENLDRHRFFGVLEEL